MKVVEPAVVDAADCCKTDQQGLGTTIGIPRSRKATCLVAALETRLGIGRISVTGIIAPL